MGDLKPLGSEKLKVDEKLKRILELTYYNTPKKTTTTSNKAEIVKESVNDAVYGIVKEKDGYYVKRGLNENSLDYIGGMFMKNKNKFSSYAEALKRMDLLVGQEKLNEATKYVLKSKSDNEAVPAPEAAPAPESIPTPEVPPAPENEEVPFEPEGGETATPEGGEEVPMAPEGDESGKPSDYMAEVQKYSGKLGQELRDQKQKMESDDIKYVLNMIISAVDLNKLDDEDIDEIGKKFNREEESQEEMPSEPEGGEEQPVEPESTEQPSDEELGETMDKLESFINSEMGEDYDIDEVNLDQFNDLSEEGNEEDVKELDLDEIKTAINQSVAETLSKYFK